jgi:uncharacterized protein YjiS (DUF1127 family)
MSAHEHISSPIMQGSAPRNPRITVAQLFLRAVQRWQKSRATAALQLLDDRQLEDIGITRNDIPRVAEGLFPPKRQASSQPSPVSRSAADPLRKAA